MAKETHAEIASDMNKIMLKMGKLRNELEKLAGECAITEVDFDRAVALAIVRLKMGKKVIVKLDDTDIDEVYESSTTAGVEKIAKGACWKQQLKMLQAEKKYKSHITSLTVLQSTLNAKQSIFRHLELNP